MKKVKRILALVLALSLLLCCFPASMISASAAEVVTANLPTATVTKLEKDDLTFAMNFKTDEVTDEQLAYYGKWFADFELTVNKEVTFDANGSGDGYLAGQYDGEWTDENWAWSGEWVNVPFKEPVTLEANKPLKIMAFAAESLNEPGLKYTFKEVYEVVKDFDCGVYFTPEFLDANPDLRVTLELKIYNPVDESVNHVIGETYVFTNEFIVAYNVQTGKNYNTVSGALKEAVSGQTVRLIRDANDNIITVLDGITLDLNGHSLEALYVFATGNVVDDSASNKGSIKTTSTMILSENNRQLPVEDANGKVAFYEVLKVNHAIAEQTETSVKYAFQPKFEAAAHEALLAGNATTKVKIVVRATWTRADGTTGVQDFVYNDTWTEMFINSYVASSGKYNKMFTLVLNGYQNYENLKYQAYVISDYAPLFTVDKANTQDVNLTDEAGSTAFVPSGAMLRGGQSSLTLQITDVARSNSNITLLKDEIQKSVDVHVDGLSQNNTVPVIVKVKGLVEAGFNNGNLKLYHVENGKTNLMTQVWALADVDKHNEFYYDPATGDVTMALATFSEIAVVSETEKKWEGKADHSWYNKDATNLTIANADQLWSFSQIVGGMAEGIERDSFEGKTVKLISDINLADGEEANDPNKIFYPIGYYHKKENTEKPNLITYSSVSSFKGTFDGNGHTIKNFYQNTWEMEGDYRDGYGADANYYCDAMGLFGYVVNGTIKNLTVDNFKSDGEFTPTGVIAAYSENSTFENIAITNCNPRVYNTGNGGIIGIAGRTNTGNQKITLKNITVDATNKITALWGSWDVACGGLVGMFRGNEAKENPGAIHFENCHVAAQIDVYNDVCANYQYYAYRYSGMIIGSVRTNEVVDGKTLPLMTGITASGCTVNYDGWNDYYYCELVANSIASYTHDYQFSRLTRVKAVNGTTITGLDGKEFTVPASGRYNYVVIKDTTKDHSTNNALCYHFVNGEVWTHAQAGKQTINGVEIDVENNHHIYLPFNQLFTGYSWGVSNVGLSNSNGFDVSGINPGALETSKEKFEALVGDNTSFETGSSITLGDLFEATASGLASEGGIDFSNLNVFVSPVGEDSTVTANYLIKNEWQGNILTFDGIGKATITITDYNFCKPTVITVNITEKAATEKFETKFTGDFLYRVGNQNAVKLDSLFKAKDGATIGTVSVTVETINGASGTYTSNETWTNGTIQFSGTGIVKVTITDNENCVPTELILEVVDAVNATGATSATSKNIVLLNDAGLSSMTVSGRYTFYGNGFTLTYTGDGRYLNNGLKQGVVTVSENGTLDNVKIKASIYPAANLYYGSNNYGEAVQDGPKEVDGDKTRYYYQLSAVAAKDNATISNCYIYGGRTNVYVNTGDVTIKDSVLECGVVANVQIQSNASHTITLEDVTTIQQQVNATIDDTSKVMLGAGVLIGPETTENPKIVLNGYFKQYNWVSEDDANAVSGDTAKMIISGALGATAYNHTINGKTASNLGIISLNKDLPLNNVENNTGLPYTSSTITMKISGQNVSGQAYSLQGATADQIYWDIENADKTTENGFYKPQFKYPDDLGGQYIEKNDDGDEHCYREGDTIHVMFPSGDTKELDLAALVNIAKYTGQNLNLVITCKDEKGSAVTVTNGKVSLSSAGEYTVTYTVTDTLFYDKDGKTVSESKSYSWDITVSVSLKDTAIPDAYFEFDATKQKMGYYKPTLGDVKQYLPFLAGLKIYDYNVKTPYLRFDGSSDFNKVASITITGYESNKALVEIKLTDGGVINTRFLARANSGGGSTYTGKIKTSNNTIYFVTDSGTSNKDTTTTAAYWYVDYYKFTGNNGVAIQSGQQTFNSTGKSASTPTGNFSTTIKYTVTYNANGGNCVQTVGYATSASAAVTLPTPRRSGYIFSGWYTAASGGTRVGGAGDSYTPSANITLYAQWGKPSTVTYNANGGSCGTESEKYTGDALTLPAPTRDGYWFLGWYDAAEGGNKIGDAGESYNPSTDITLYAHWQEAIEYTVTYNANGGSCGTVSDKYQGTALTLPTPTKEGHTFQGWYTAASGGTKIGDAGASYIPSANVTLYAQWTINSYTITVTTNNATVKVNGTTVNNNGTVSIQYGTQVTVDVTYSENDSKSTTIEGTDGTKYTSPFTMPAQNVEINATSTECITPDTLITLADGTQVRVDSLKGDEMLLVWNLETGKFDYAPIMFTDSEEEAEYEIVHLYFSDGTDVKVIYEHGFWDYDLNKYVYLDRYAAKYIGHTFAKQNGDTLTKVVLTDVVIETMVTTAWSPVTAGHLCYFVNGMLSMPGGVGGLFNIFEVNPETMTYDYEQMAKDIETYGLFTYEEVNAIEELPLRMFEEASGAYLKISIAKGNMTVEDLAAMIRRYRSFFE